MPGVGRVWKRLQRVNKRAAKFQFTASYHELHLETTAKWRPSNLSVVWTRRSRRVASSPLPWEPDMMNPLVGHVLWPVPDNHAITVTLFKDARTHELEDKDWTFVIEDVTAAGKKRVLANASINMRKYASIESTQQSFTLTLKPASRKITAAELELTISCVFLREGKATDEDMQSVVSLMSVNNNCDVAPLDDLEDLPDLENSADISDHFYDFTQQLEQMTTSLTGCMDLPTPLSVPSLSEDPTPLAETNTLHFEFEAGDSTVRNNTVGTHSIEMPTEDNLKTPSPETGQSSAVATTTTTATAATVTPVTHSNERKARPQQNSMTTTTDSKLMTTNDFEANLKDFSKCMTSTPISKTTKGHDVLNKDLQNAGGARKGLQFSTTLTTGEVKDEEIQGNNSKSNRTVVGTKLNESNEATTTSLTTSSNTNPDTQNTAEKAYSSQSNNSTNVDIAAENDTLPATYKLENKRPELQPLNLRKSYNTSNETSNHPANNNNKTNNNSTSSQITMNGSLKNSSNHSVGNNKPVEKIILKENTPGQDLLEWCKEITKDYPNVKVTNLTTSWRNGIAFCAIIHHFQPHLIDMTKLTAHDVVGNCRLAFDAAETLGIPRVIEPRDMSLLAVPDKLAVMTYLHQLRAHFTGKQLQIEQIGTTSDESSYVIGNYKTDNLLSQNLLNLSHLKAQLLHQNSLDDEIYALERNQCSPTNKKDVKNLILSGSKSILGKVLTPTKDKSNTNPILQQSTNNSPLIEDNDAIVRSKVQCDDKTELQSSLTEKLNNSNEENINQNNSAQTAVTPSTFLDPKILSRHRIQSEKARLMIEKLKASHIASLAQDEERQQRLREQARRLIMEARHRTNTVAGQGDFESPASPTINSKSFNHFNSESSSINNGTILTEDVSTNSPLLLEENSNCKRSAAEQACDNDSSLSNKNKSSPSHKLSTYGNNGSIYANVNTSNSNSNSICSSPLQSFDAVMERISPKIDKKSDKLSYIESELEALEREQVAIDQKASRLEEKLRAVMNGSPKTEETEEQLLSQWFTLVNKKNALLRRQMQLNILEQESDLERKYTMLNQELRAAQSVEDWRKTEAQREKERLLLEELVAIVDKRNELVQRLHNEEIAIEDDHEIARELEQVDISGSKDKCSIQ